MNIWNYQIISPSGVKDFQMGGGLTIESVFKSLKPNEKLFRVKKKDPSRKDICVKVLPSREWNKV